MKPAVSGVYPSITAIQCLVSGGLECVDKAIKQQSSLAVRHNTYTDYCLALLFNSTAHRPIIDPFQSLSQFDLKNGLLLVSDKVTSESRAWNLVALPPLAVKQIHGYLEYLKKLSASLLKEPEGDILAWNIYKLVSGDESNLPLFFYLEDKPGAWRSVRPSELSQRLSTYWAFPLNFLRHIAATELTRKAQRADWAQIQLGHIDGLDHPFGVTSTVSAMEVLSEIGGHLDNILRTMGWQYLPPPIRMPTVGFVTGRSVKAEKKRRLGHEERELRREKRKEKAATLVRGVLQERLGKRAASSIDEDEFGQLLDAIVRIASDENISPNHCLRLFYRYLRQLRGGADVLRRVSRVRVIEPEPSPYSAETLNHYRDLVTLREQFLAYLDMQGRNQALPSRNDRLAEILLSSILFGRLASKKVLTSLWEALNGGVYQFEDRLFVDIPLGDETTAVWRWFPDPVSTSLVLGLYKEANHLIGENRQTLEVGLRKIVGRVRGRSGRKSALEELVSLSAVGLTLEVPGFVAGVLRGDIPAVSLPLRSFIRINRDEALALQGSGQEANAGIQSSEVWAPSVQHAAIDGEKLSGNAFLLQLQYILSSCSDVPPSGRLKVNTRRKVLLASVLEKEFGKLGKWNTISLLLVAWAAYLCKKGTRQKKNLAYSTIEKYVPLVAKPLCKIVGDEDFLAFDDGAFEEVYLRALELKRPHQREYLAGRLREFHDFVADLYECERPDWSSVMSMSGAVNKVAYADANYISLPEYLSVLECIRKDESLPIRIRSQYSLLWMMGYRFGLRFGESWYLLYRDIQYDEAHGELYVHIRDNVYRKTKTSAGVRIIPLVETLTPDEEVSLKEVMAWQESSYVEDPQAPLMAANDNTRSLIGRDEAVQYLHDLMREVTGDRKLRYHHLRHSWATRMVCQQYFSARDDTAGVVTTMLPVNVTSHGFAALVGDSSCSYPLRSISTALGHAGESMTLAGYTHCMDLIVSDLTHRLAPMLADYATSYSLGTAHATVRRRRSRKGEAGSHDLMMNRRTTKYIPAPAVKTEKRSGECRAENKASELTNLSLAEIDSLLRRYGYTVGGIGATARRQLVDDVQAEKVIAAATKLERESGYTSYQLESRLIDPLLAGVAMQAQNSVFSRLENKRIARIVSEYEARNGADSHEEHQHIRLWLGVWQRTYNHSTKTNLVTDIEELTLLSHGLGELAPDIEYVVVIGEEAPGNTELVRELAKMGYHAQKSRIQVPREKSRIRRSARVELKVTNPGLDLVTRSTLHRLCFLLSIATEAKSDPFR